MPSTAEPLRRQASLPLHKRGARRACLALRWVVGVYRRATASLRVLPDFVNIGVQKGGTSALYKYLADHPCVLTAFNKEVMFFSNHFNEGLAWYRSRFPYRATRERIRHHQGMPCLVGEASTYYIFHPRVPERMRALLPDVRLIAVLRDPVDRAISHYHHNLRAGYETLSVEEALAAEEERTAGEATRLADDPPYQSLAYQRFSYVARGKYIDQIKRWHAHFPRSQLLIIRSEDLRDHSPETFASVLEFLGLPPWEPKAFEAYNVGQYSESHTAVRRHLAEVFEPFNQRLYEYLGVEWRWGR